MTIFPVRSTGKIFFEKISKNFPKPLYNYVHMCYNKGEVKGNTLTNMKEVSKMIVALLEYIGRNGKIIMKSFTNMDDAYSFCKRLDERIEKGTCGGYLLTEL